MKRPDTDTMVGYMDEIHTVRFIVIFPRDSVDYSFQLSQRPWPLHSHNIYTGRVFWAGDEGISLVPYDHKPTDTALNEVVILWKEILEFA